MARGEGDALPWHVSRVSAAARAPRGIGGPLVAAWQILDGFRQPAHPEPRGDSDDDDTPD